MPKRESSGVAYPLKTYLSAFKKDVDVFEYAFVESTLIQLPFFASRVKLGGWKGIESVIPSDLEGLSAFELSTLQALKPSLRQGLKKALPLLFPTRDK